MYKRGFFAEKCYTHFRNCLIHSLSFSLSYSIIQTKNGKGLVIASLCFFCIIYKRCHDINVLKIFANIHFFYRQNILTKKIETLQSDNKATLKITIFAD